jgi:N-acetylneuraminic acid mutarotase
VKNRRTHALFVGLFCLLACLSARADLWATNGSLITARFNHTATLLPNGKVLIAGGNTNNTSYLASAELYDPATGTCTNTGSMLVARARHTATLLNNGKVLVAGGLNSAVLSDAELYDPSTGTWSSTGPLEVPRLQHTATLLPDGTVLVAGGSIAPGEFPTNSAELYNPATGTWSQVGPMNTARMLHTATLMPNGQVMVAAGEGTNGTWLSSTEIYDPATATWTTTNSLNTARVAHTATLLPNGQVLVAGGESSTSGIILSSAEIFDPASGTWTTTNSMNTAHVSHTATLLPDGKVLVASGNTYFFNFTNSSELYDPNTGTWANAAFVNLERHAHAATLLPSGKVLLTGGSDVAIIGPHEVAVAPIAPTETYDSTVNPATGAWSNTAPMQNPRRGFTMTLLPNGKALVAGGMTFGNVVIYSNAELYDPMTESWTNTGAMNEARVAHTATLLPNGKVLVTGGSGDQNNPYRKSSSELYDPSTGIWTETTPMNTSRDSHTATLLHNGKVLVAGGNIFPGSPSSEIYDSVATTWTTTGEMNFSRQLALAVLLTNGKVLVMTGLEGMTDLATVELYDPATGKWALAGTTTVVDSTYAAAALLPGGKVLLAGADTNHLPAANMYDPVSGTWTTIEPPNAVHLEPTATLLSSGKVLLAGWGTTNFEGNLYDSSISAELFDPSTGQWMNTGELNQSREDHMATLLPDGRVLIAGGDYGSALSSAELYDPGLGSSNAWRPQITSATSPINLNGTLTITGTGFQGISEASGGNVQNSSTAFPLVQLRNIENQQTTFLSTTNWSTNSFTSLPIWNFPPGYTLATVFVNGIQSTSSIVDISVPIPTRTTLTGTQIGTNGAFQFNFTNSPGALLGVLASTNLTLPLSNWTALNGITEVSPGQFQFTDPQATNSPQQFYQLFAP